MSELYVLPEDIRNEFIVKEDGRVVAKSWNAVARLAGVKHNSILDKLIPRVLNTSPETSESLPKSLQPLAGKDLRNATEIDEITISCIINYYAWQSQQGANDTAKRVALALSAVGTRAYFQKELKWHDPRDTKLDRLETLILGLVDDMAAFKNTGRQYPGIQNIVQNTTNNNIFILPPDFKEPFSIREWVLVTQGRNLTSGECRSIGRMVAGTMTTLKLESPIKYGTAKVYRYSDMPALQTIYKSWLLTAK